MVHNYQWFQSFSKFFCIKFQANYNDPLILKIEYKNVLLNLPYFYDFMEFKYIFLPNNKEFKNIFKKILILL